MGGRLGASYRGLASLGWLYLVQGIPYGLQDKFLPLQLRSIGLNYSSVSLLKLLLLPWIAKGIWAPVVEVYGGRHLWLLISTLGLGAASLAGSFIAPEDVTRLGAMLLALNVCSAVQDVAVDGIALQVLPDEQLGLGNTVQVVLYKVGCLVGGAGLSFLLAWTDWTATFAVLAAVYVVTTVWVYFLSFKSVTSTGRSLPGKVVQDEASPRCSGLQFDRVLGIAREVTGSTGTLWISLYVLLYKMGERGAINNMPLYLLDRGFSKGSLSFWNGTVCQGLSVLGSVYGGVALSKSHSSLKMVILRHSCYRFVLVSIQCVLVSLLEQHWSDRHASVLHYLSIVSLCLLSFSSGVISTATFTLMMVRSRACSPQSQASHYSVLASVEVAGKLAFASLAGFGIEHFGMVLTFSLFASLCAVPVMVVCATPRHLYTSVKKE